MATEHPADLETPGAFRATPTTVEEITAWLEAAAHWNQDPTPFEWGGKRQERRQRERRHALGGSGAYTRTPVRRRPIISYAHEHDK